MGGREGWCQTCPATGLRSYVTRQAARRRRRRIAQDTRSPVSALYIDPCEPCGYWHVRWRPLEAADA